jgi:hypothetical protein
MTTDSDIQDVIGEETARGRRYVAGQGLAVAAPPAKTVELTSRTLKVQKFGALIVRLGEAIEGVPEDEARQALEIVLARLRPAEVRTLGTVLPAVDARPRPTRPVLAPRAPTPGRMVHASGSGVAAETLRQALKARGGEATTRELADDVGKSTSTVTHTLVAMGERVVTRPSRGHWRLTKVGGS